MSIKVRLAEFWNPEDVSDSLWRMFASPYTTMLLLIGLAALVCVGIFVPQRPAQAVADLTANSLWLASLRERYQSATDWLVGLSLVDIHRSMLLRGLLGLLAFNLLLGTVDLIHPWHLVPLAIPRSRHQSGSPHGGGTLVGGTSLSEAPGRLLERLKEALLAHRYRLHEGSNRDWLYADRFVVFTVLVYLGLLLLIGGLALSEGTAWWEEGVTLRPGQVLPLGHGTELAVRAQVSEASYDATTDKWHEQYTELTFLREHQQVEQRALYDHAPSFYAGLLFYPTSTVPALLVQAQDATGRNLALQTPESGATQLLEVALVFRQEESPQYIIMLDLKPGSQRGRQFQEKANERYVIVPGRDLYLRVLHAPPGPGESGPTFHVEGFRGSETSPFFEHQLSSEDSVEIAGDRYVFEAQRYAVIKFGQDYGLAPIFVGAAMVLVGIVLSAWRHPRRVWVVPQFAEGEVSLHFASAPVPEKTSGWFEDLVQSVANTLALTVQSAPYQEPAVPSEETDAHCLE
jgi:hypothetical protein